MLRARTSGPTEHTFTQLSTTLNPQLTANISGICGAGMDLLFLMPSFSYAINIAWDIMLLGQIIYADYQGKFTDMGNAIFIRTKWNY